MSFPINTTIPNAPNDPADDQPLMKDNFNNINSLFSVNHFVPGAAGNGKHQKVEMPAGMLPTGLAANEATLYAKGSGGSTQVYYTPGVTGNEYQLTRSITASFALFGTNTNYLANHVGGWTFLPGGMILQYGFRSSPGASGTITFPVAFATAPYSVTVVANRGDTSGGSGITVISSTSTTSLSYICSTGGNTGLFWTAIGV